MGVAVEELLVEHVSDSSDPARCGVVGEVVDAIKVGAESVVEDVATTVVVTVVVVVRVSVMGDCAVQLEGVKTVRVFGMHAVRVGFGDGAMHVLLKPRA